MCEDRDKELGVKPSDYTFCDVPVEEENNLSGTVEEVDLNLMVCSKKHSQCFCYKSMQILSYICPFLNP